MDHDLFCKCGKEAISFMADAGSLCLDCMAKKIDDATTEEQFYDQVYRLLTNQLV